MPFNKSELRYSRNVRGRHRGEFRAKRRLHKHSKHRKSHRKSHRKLKFGSPAYRKKYLHHK
jgi:hypothetical protein